MFILLGGLLGLLAGLATGGSFSRLAQLRLRWPWIVVLALVIKEAGVFSPLARSALGPWLFAASLVVLIAWTAWHRQVLRGVLVVSAGMALNLLVVLANLGHMPVAERLAHRGVFDLTKQHQIGQYVLAGPDTHLNWLGDWIGLPGGLGKVFPEAYSPGDLLSYLGIVIVMFLATRSGPVQNARPGAPLS